MASLPTFDPSNFSHSTDINNPYLSFVPGTTFVYNDGTPNFTDTITVTDATRRLDGVNCVAVSDVSVQDGQVIEKTTDFYAQDNSGNVWYMGELTREFTNGHLTSKEGTWQAGHHHAAPGVIMLAHPESFIGVTYSQEDAPNVAEDRATNLTVHGTAPQTIPFSNGGAQPYTNLLVTNETSLIEPTANEDKYYLKGVGFIFSFDHSDNSFNQLVSVTHDGTMQTVKAQSIASNLTVTAGSHEHAQSHDSGHMMVSVAFDSGHETHGAGHLFFA
ncbi:MAG TPA: hypothetical protein VM659_03705 [Dongiaceae bacterium]|nr:hypothetical protein [Dongiaceae bacterium]